MSPSSLLPYLFRFWLRDGLVSNINVSHVAMRVVREEEKVFLINVMHSALMLVPWLASSSLPHLLRFWPGDGLVSNINVHLVSNINVNHVGMGVVGEGNFY